MRKIRRNDTVLVITGKDRGKTGVVRAGPAGQAPRRSSMGVNMIKKHQRPTQQAGVPAPGGIVVHGGAAARLQRDAGLQGVQQADPRRLPRAAGRRQGARVQACGADID